VDSFDIQTTTFLSLSLEEGLHVVLALTKGMTMYLSLLRARARGKVVVVANTTQ
jgi:hypothetical protein